MRTSFFKTICMILMVCLFARVVVSAQGQESSQIPAQIYNIGALQEDNSVLYSILFYSGPENLEKLTISGAVPDNATLDKIIIAPASAQAASDSSLKWTFDKVAAHTVLGPFTYQVKLKSADKPAPSGVPAQASWLAPVGGSVNAKLVDEALKPLDKVGKITVDPKGTVNDKGEPSPIQIANTGIWVFAPGGSVSQPTELTFTRMTIDDSALPADVKDTWWCVLIGIEASPKVALSNPILVGLPTRQVLTAGISAQAFIRNGNEKWQTVPTTQALRIAGNGNLAEVMITGQIPQLLAVGVKSLDRKNASTTIPISVNGGFQQGGFQGGFQGFQLGGFQGFQGAQFGGNCGFQGGFQGGFQRTC